MESPRNDEVNDFSHYELYDPARSAVIRGMVSDPWDEDIVVLDEFGWQEHPDHWPAHQRSVDPSALWLGD